MIEAKELRIGSYLQSSKGQLRVVTELNNNKDEDNVLAWGVGNDRMFGTPQGFLKPILLTEEWLVNFGFEKSKLEGAYYLTHPFPFTVYFDGTRLSIAFWQGNEKKYVHQLQNLYFALTGEELQMKSESSAL